MTNCEYKIEKNKRIDTEDWENMKYFRGKILEYSSFVTCATLYIGYLHKKHTPYFNASVYQSSKRRMPVFNKHTLNIFSGVC